jgi:hypothetical protein
VLAGGQKNSSRLLDPLVAAHEVVKFRMGDMIVVVAHEELVSVF